MRKTNLLSGIVPCARGSVRFDRRRPPAPAIRSRNTSTYVVERKQHGDFQHVDMACSFLEVRASSYLIGLASDRRQWTV